MHYSDVLARLRALGQRLESHGQVFFFRLDVDEAVKSEQLGALANKIGHPIAPGLKSAWAVSASVDLEWFVKGPGCKVAGIDSHSAPSGQFRLLSPEDALSEWEFLQALAGDEQAKGLLPFSKVSPGGELLVVDLSSGAVQLVFLDSELTTVALAESLDAWFNERIGTYFEERSLRQPGFVDPGVEVTLEQMAAEEFSWPPRKIGW